MYNISFKAYSNNNNAKAHELINIAAWIWNHSVALQRRYYRIYGGYINVNRLQKHIAKLRNRNTKWQKLNSQTVQEICQRLDASYARFFKKLAERPPKFKKAKNFNSIVFKNSGWSINGNVFTINKVGRFKFSQSRYYENVKRVTVKRNKLGELFIILCCDMKPRSCKRLDNSSIGMDFGLKMFLTCSNGEEIKSPEYLKQSLKKIRRANKSFSKKKEGSNNRKKALKALVRAHIDVTNRRNDFHWKLAHHLCKHNEFIAIEDLNMKAMKKLWGRKVSDLAFSSFVDILQQVAIKYDTTIQKVGRFYASSKTCGCGCVNKELKLSDREWVCGSCGVVNQRDYLASNNILTEGIRLCRTKCKTSVTEAV